MTHSISRAFWSATSRTWDDALADADIAQHVDDLADWLAGALPANGRVADLGCGTGNYSAALAARGLRVCGIDSSTGMLQRAMTKLGFALVRADLTAPLPFADAALDGVISVFAGQFLDLDPFVADIRRVVRPGAAVLVELPQVRVTQRRSVRSLSWRDRAIRGFKKATPAVGVRTGVVRRHSEEDLRGALERAGFDQLDTRATDGRVTVLGRAA